MTFLPIGNTLGLMIIFTVLIWAVAAYVWWRYVVAKPKPRQKRNPKPGDRHWVLRHGNEGRNLWRINTRVYIKAVDHDNVMLIDDFDIQHFSLSDFHKLYREAI